MHKAESGENNNLLSFFLAPRARSPSRRPAPPPSWESRRDPNLQQSSFGLPAVRLFSGLWICRRGGHDTVGFTDDGAPSVLVTDLKMLSQRCIGAVRVARDD